MKNIVIALSDDSVQKVDELANMFTREGMQVNNVFEYGVIIGSADDSTIEKIRNYKEVISLELEKVVTMLPRTKT